LDAQSFAGETPPGLRFGSPIPVALQRQMNRTDAFGCSPETTPDGESDLACWRHAGCLPVTKGGCEAPAATRVAHRKSKAADESDFGRCARNPPYLLVRIAMLLAGSGLTIAVTAQRR
jgi:hypothetical protein